MVVVLVVSRGPDIVVWGGKASGRFSTKSAYNLVVGHSIEGLVIIFGRKCGVLKDHSVFASSCGSF